MNNFCVLQPAQTEPCMGEFYHLRRKAENYNDKLAGALQGTFGQYNGEIVGYPSIVRTFRFLTFNFARYFPA